MQIYDSVSLNLPYHCRVEKLVTICMLEERQLSHLAWLCSLELEKSVYNVSVCISPV